LSAPLRLPPPWALLLLAVTTALLSGCGSPSSTRSAASAGADHPPSTSAAPQPTTATHTLTPAAAGAATRSGSCFTSSITVAAADAYRCFAGDAILDPCYATTAAAHTLTCYADPWSSPVAVRLTKALPAGAPTPVHRPWAIQLTGQTRCVAATGVVPVVRGTPLTYSCRDGGAAALTGAPTAALRTAVYRPAPGSALRPVTITDVWSG
jgi:hypothetical protein